MLQYPSRKVHAQHSTYLVENTAGAPDTWRDDEVRSGLHTCMVGFPDAVGPHSTWMRASQYKARFSTMGLLDPDVAGCFGNKPNNCQKAGRVLSEMESAQEMESAAGGRQLYLRHRRDAPAADLRVARGVTARVLYVWWCLYLTRD